MTAPIPFYYATAKHPGLIPVTTWPELEALRAEHHQLIAALIAAEDRLTAACPQNVDTARRSVAAATDALERFMSTLAGVARDRQSEWRRAVDDAEKAAERQRDQARRLLAEAAAYDRNTLTLRNFVLYTPQGHWIVADPDAVLR